MADNDNQPMKPDAPQSIEESAAQLLDKLKTKTAAWLGTGLVGLVLFLSQWAIPEGTEWKTPARLLLLSGEVGLLLLIVLAIICASLFLQKLKLERKPNYPIICGLKWSKDAQPLCPKCENPVHELHTPIFYMGCAYCDVDRPPTENGHNVNINHAVKVAREQLGLPKL